MKKKYNFICPTLKFCIAGFLIPGFTAVVILGLQMAIGLLGIECAKTWVFLWISTTVGALIAPFIFVRIMDKRLSEEYNLATRTLVTFNIIEYTFLQCSLATFFTSGETLCYVTDGQNGLEFVFTGWMAIPILIVLSLGFDILRERKMEQLKTNDIRTRS